MDPNISRFTNALGDPSDIFNKVKCLSIVQNTPSFEIFNDIIANKHHFNSLRQLQLTFKSTAHDYVKFVIVPMMNSEKSTHLEPLPDFQVKSVITSLPRLKHVKIIYHFARVHTFYFWTVKKPEAGEENQITFKKCSLQTNK